MKTAYCSLHSRLEPFTEATNVETKTFKVQRTEVVARRDDGTGILYQEDTGRLAQEHSVVLECGARSRIVSAVA